MSVAQAGPSHIELPTSFVLLAVLPPALALCSTVREEEASGTQLRVTTGRPPDDAPQTPARWTAPPAASRALLKCATKLWRIGSSANRRAAASGPQCGSAAVSGAWCPTRLSSQSRSRTISRR